MNSQEQQRPVVSSPVPAFRDTHSGFANRIFLNEEGLRAGWRLLLYLALVVGFFLSFKVLLMQFWKSTAGTFSIGGIFFSELIGFASAFGAAIVMSFLERRPVGIYGLPAHSAFGKLFWQGVLFGLVEISLVIELIHLFGGYSFGTLALHGTEIIRWAVLWALCLLFVGLFEEFLFRGYSLFTLSSGLGFWPSAIVLSLVFAAVHFQNNGEGLVGVAGVFVVGLLWCLALRRTGTLWFAVGMHAAFDFGETFLYSVPDSGALFPGHLSNATMAGPAWLTGGAVGPEGSVFDFLILFIFFYVIHRLYPPNNALLPSNALAQRASSDANTSFTP